MVPAFRRRAAASPSQLSRLDLRPRWADHVRLPLLEDERGRPMQALERPGVGPPTVHDAVGERAPVDVSVVDIRDLELAARRGLEALDDLEDPAVVDVDARDRKPALRVLGLLLDPD